MSDDALPAGEFSTWIEHARGALRGDNAADVPCDGCTACCRAAQFVHIDPDETDTLAAIPADLLFPAPGLPKGHVVLGYDEHGHCPMLVDDRCSIYAHRPRTCRTYDCRVFPAAAVAADDPSVDARASRWRFDYADDSSRERHDAVRATADYLRHHPDAMPAAANRPTQLAVAAVDIHELFAGAAPEAVAVQVELRRWARRH